MLLKFSVSPQFPAASFTQKHGGIETKWPVRTGQACVSAALEQKQPLTPRLSNSQGPISKMPAWTGGTLPRVQFPIGLGADFVLKATKV